MDINPFSPVYGSGVSVTATSSSQSATIQDGSIGVVVTNTGTNLAYVNLSPNGGAATSADYLVLPSSQVVLPRSDEVTSFRYISPAGTTLHVICGQGF